MDRVCMIRDKDQFEVILSDAAISARIVAVSFSASWCQPCKLMAPCFERLAEEYPDVVFVKIDVDLNEALAAEYTIAAMPTFCIIRQGKQVAEMLGTDKKKLAMLISKWAQDGPDAHRPATL